MSVIQIVLQHPHEKACQQACIAILASRTLEQVIADAGTDQPLDEGVRRRLYAEYGLGYEGSSYHLETFGNRALGAIIREHDTLLCSVYSYIDINYAHCVVLHKGELYDPWHGMNPTWPWHRHVGKATPIKINP